MYCPGIGKEAGAEWNRREDERSETMVPVIEGKPVWEFPDTGAEVYKDELEAELRRTRAERYAHLNDRRFEKIVELVRRRSQTFYVEGAPSTVIKGVEFDIELKEGAKPQKARQPMISPAEAAKQQVRIASCAPFLSVPAHVRLSVYPTVAN